MSNVDQSEEESAKLGDLVRDPNVWGRARIIAIHLADEASTRIMKRGNESGARLKNIMSTIIGGINTSLFFADMLGLTRVDMENIVERVMRAHYAPVNSTTRDEQESNVVSLETWRKAAENKAT